MHKSKVERIDSETIDQAWLSVACSIPREIHVYKSQSVGVV
jgi:hypothetical protein